MTGNTGPFLHEYIYAHHILKAHCTHMMNYANRYSTKYAFGVCAYAYAVVRVCAFHLKIAISEVLIFQEDILSFFSK